MQTRRDGWKAEFCEDDGSGVWPIRCKVYGPHGVVEPVWLSRGGKAIANCSAYDLINTPEPEPTVTHEPPMAAEAACDVGEAIEAPLPRAMKRWLKRNGLTAIGIDGFALEISLRDFDMLFPTCVYYGVDQAGNDSQWAFVEDGGFTFKVHCRVNRKPAPRASFDPSLCPGEFVEVNPPQRPRNRLGWKTTPEPMDIPPSLAASHSQAQAMTAFLGCLTPSEWVENDAETVEVTPAAFSDMFGVPDGECKACEWSDKREAWLYVHLCGAEIRVNCDIERTLRKVGDTYTAKVAEVVG